MAVPGPVSRFGRYLAGEEERDRARNAAVAAATMDGAADEVDEEDFDEDEITVNAAGSANNFSKVATATRSQQSATKIIAGLQVVRPVTARLVNGHTLVIRYNTRNLDRQTYNDSISSFASANKAGNDAGDDNVDGPNARGTYAREYTLRHPEIKWVHRGQGRYLPAGEIKRESMAAPERRSRHSRGDPEKTNVNTPHIKKEHSEPDGTSNSIRSSRWRLSDAGRIPSFGRQESSVQSPDEEEEEAPRARAVRNSLTDSLSHPPQYGLRQRQSDPPTPSMLENRTARLARRAKLIPSIERGRTTLRRGSVTAATHNHDTESDTEGDEEDMAGDDATKTYTKAHVQANKHEEYHHTGNGWYRKGPRPAGKVSNKGKERSTDRAPQARAPPPNYNFDDDQTVHRDDLSNYPGMMFHHKGNAWFRPGIDTKNRPKTKVVDADGNVRTLDEVEKEEAASGASISTAGTVDKAYADTHPNINWEHRGNGRYAERPKARRTSTKTASTEPVPTTERRKSESQTFSKEYVLEHPEKTFYHTGNARYKLGARPQALPASMRAMSSGGGLVDKAYVDAHPDEEFHHRGQGRYARGPRLSTATPAAEDEIEDEEMEEEEEEEEDDDLPPEVDDADENLGDRTRLVDTTFVNTHPGTTFYHKGQGRWAFGLPPPGSHNKIAVRGPKAIRWNAIKAMENDPEFGLPKQNELLRREDGPDKFPNLHWVYRGGGKWARISKAEAELGFGQKGGRQSMGSLSKPAAKKRRVTGSGAGMGSAAASVAGVNEDEEMMDTDALNTSAFTKPKKSRQRKSQHAQPDPPTSKNSSTSHSQAPTPKPRMLEPDEDLLTDSDLPDIYHDTTPPTPDEGDEDDIDRQLREQFRALNTDALMASLTKFDPAVRSTKNLYAVAENTMKAMAALQEEYIELDKITAPHAKIPKRPVKGGREPVDPQVFEDRKEADLYDYAFEKGRIGFQDPEAQKIVRDAEGRELRKRRRVGGNGIGGVEPADVIPGWRWGEEISGVGEKRASRQPARFDSMGEAANTTPTVTAGVGGGGGGAGQQKRKARNPLGLNGKGGSLTPGRGGTPISGAFAGAEGFGGVKVVGNVPRRIQELRGESVASDGGSGKGGKKGKGVKGGK